MYVREDCCIKIYEKHKRFSAGFLSTVMSLAFKTCKYDDKHTNGLPKTKMIEENTHLIGETK